MGKLEYYVNSFFMKTYAFLNELITKTTLRKPFNFLVLIEAEIEIS